MNQPTAQSTGAEPRGHLPGELGVWMFIFGDMFVFSLFCFTFAFYRGEQVDVFQQSQVQLNQGVGLLSTLILLSSSWFVASGVKLARWQRNTAATSFFGLAFLCAVGFGVVKFFEYGEMLNVGITPKTNDFFMYYYIFTGVH